MQVTGTFKALTYEEDRYEFFLLKKHEAERKLQGYQEKLKYAFGYWRKYILNMCSELEAEIKYYNDALKVFDVNTEVKE